MSTVPAVIVGTSVIVAPCAEVVGFGVWKVSGDGVETLGGPFATREDAREWVSHYQMGPANIPLTPQVIA